MTSPREGDRPSEFHGRPLPPSPGDGGGSAPSWHCLSAQPFFRATETRGRGAAFPRKVPLSWGEGTLEGVPEGDTKNNLPWNVLPSIIGVSDRGRGEGAEGRPTHEKCLGPGERGPSRGCPRGTPKIICHGMPCPQ